MARTYSSLIKGAPLKIGEELILHGIKYKVDGYGGTRFFLCATESWDNGAVFKKFSQDKYDWARKYRSTGSGDFPEFTNLNSLTKFVISIYEEPEFKEGDYVTIIEREGVASDYPASYVDDMVNYVGKTFVVKDLCLTESADDRKYFNGDPHWYYLETPSGNWIWHSSMFREATAEEVLVAQGAKGDVGVKCDCGSSSDSITGDTGTPKLKSKYLEEIKSLEEFLGDNTDCALRLPKNTDKVHHINL